MAKVNVYIPDDLLDRVDADASLRSASRSSVVQEALTQYLTKGDASRQARALQSSGLDALARMERLAHAWDHDEPSTETTWVDSLRELRARSHG